MQSCGSKEKAIQFLSLSKQPYAKEDRLLLRQHWLSFNLSGRASTSQTSHELIIGSLGQPCAPVGARKLALNGLPLF